MSTANVSRKRARDANSLYAENAIHRTPNKRTHPRSTKSPFWSTLSPLNSKVTPPRTPNVSRVMGVVNHTPRANHINARTAGVSHIPHSPSAWASPTRVPASSSSSSLPSPGLLAQPRRSRDNGHRLAAHSVQMLEEAINKNLADASIGVHLPPRGAAVCLQSDQLVSRPYSARSLDFSNTAPLFGPNSSSPTPSETFDEYDEEENETGSQLDSKDRMAARQLISLSPKPHRKRSRSKLLQNANSDDEVAEDEAVVNESPVRRTSSSSSALSKRKLLTSPSGGSQLRQNSRRASRPARRAAHSSGGSAPAPARSKTSKSRSAGQKGCNCKKSKCLKLYCECFARQGYCSDACNCLSCHNIIQREDVRQKTIASILARDPNAFFRAEQKQHSKHAKGCHCKKSHCLKKYCECFQAGIQCSELCKCLECQNGGHGQNAHAGTHVVKRKTTKRVSSRRARSSRGPAMADGVDTVPPTASALTAAHESPLSGFPHAAARRTAVTS